MTRRGALLALAGIALIGYLLYGTVTSQKVTCSVVMEFEGRRDSATASAADAEAAAEQARTTACATISSGMNGRIACGNRQPVRRDCRSA